MSSKPDMIGIIPARYESSRFPGKPLASILGKPMFWHVYQRAAECTLLDHIVLATDHPKILNAARELGVPAVMTAVSHRSGTDRVLEASRMLDISSKAIVVNIQGDEPALDPRMLEQLLSPFVSDPHVNICTLARKAAQNEVENPNVVKVVFSQSNRALYFSRSPIPFSRGNKAVQFAHIGLYAFRMSHLELFSSLSQGRLELTEKLEQLRLLEADIPIHVVVTELKCHGVDTPNDIINVTKLIQEKHNESYSGT
ncbi:3-deoxy-manno-octulosonate cytidylyltransferase [Desulfonatronovibrio hydrogenovorans]|uniref:3-deoxy-manno-octulosonate cytidylyltransferase n=1 Tax=Desulfonatronovibrio hydrogenovorans TaxID=53245 RepID=UPI00048B49A1|nr:3-deoxy-manno-octulosonate cytidylyltransferase [Desulfonatronovibrio hydrogenovorans]